MASIVFVDTVTQIPADWANDVNTLTYAIFNGAQNVAQALTALGLSWANPDALTATMVGGSIDGTPIGATTPSTGAFTTLTATTQGAGAHAVALVPFVTSAVAALQATLGTMAEQNANAVVITGGTIDGTIIGSNTPAAATFTRATISAAPVQSTDVANKAYVDSRIASLPAFGTMALQNAIAVAITGGTLDDVVIGGTTPAEAFFLAITATQITNGTGGSIYLNGSLPSYFTNGVVLKGSTSLPDITLLLGSTGTLRFQDGAGNTQFSMSSAGRIAVGTVDDGQNMLQVVGGGRVDTLTITGAVSQPNYAATKQYVDTSAANVAAGVAAQITSALATLGNMSAQDSSAVTITGGTIDGTAIGSSTPANGTFLSVVANSVGGASGSLVFNQTGSNAIVLNAASPSKPSVAALLNTGGTFSVASGINTLFQVLSSGRTLIGLGTTDDGASNLSVGGQATVSGQLIIPQAPGSPNAAANKAYVDTQIQENINGSLVTEAWVNNQIATAVAPLATTAQLNAAVSGLVNQSYVSAQITNALEPYATQVYVAGSISSALTTYATQAYVNSQIAAATTTFATEAYVNNALLPYVTATYVSNALTSYLQTSTLAGSGGAALVGYGATTVDATLTALYGAQAANTVLAGPISGANAVPTYRALETQDLPSTISATTITTNSFTASSITTASFTATADSVSFTGTGAIQVPSGTTANRPALSAGLLRFNSSTTVFEVSDGTGWYSYLSLNGGTLAGVVANSAYAASAPATGATITVGANKAITYVDPTADIAALTIGLPTPISDGDIRTFSFLHAVAAITWTPASGTVDSTVPTAATAGQVIRIQWRADINTWRNC